MTRYVQALCGFFRPLGPCFFLVIGLCLSVAQTAPTERTFDFSKAEVEKALREIQADAGGRLPMLEGFVTQNGSLEKYQRGYYQYVLLVKPISANRVSLQATAKITAWYAGDNASKSGYRALVSNGRLESDLLDRLDEQLHSQAAKSSPQNAPQQVQPSAGTRAIQAETKANSSEALLKSQTSPALPTREESAAIAAEHNDKHLQGLMREKASLEEILRSQTRPDNLVAVKSNRTPVYARPSETSQVLFLADAEDEFQMVEEAGSWVHFQISGIARGWIQRSLLELPTDSRATASASDVRLETELFRQTREETSMFPGNWEALRGKQVKIVWVQPSGKADQDSRLNFARRIFRKEYPEVAKTVPSVAGVVVVFDSQDGGMAAATLATLQQWHAGHLTDDAFWKRCWLDPEDAFKER